MFQAPNVNEVKAMIGCLNRMLVYWHSQYALYPIWKMSLLAKRMIKQELEVNKEIYRPNMVNGERKESSRKLITGDPKIIYSTNATDQNP